MYNRHAFNIIGSLGGIGRLPVYNRHAFNIIGSLGGNCAASCV